jgi:hypothetical protein
MELIRLAQDRDKSQAVVNLVNTVINVRPSNSTEHSVSVVYQLTNCIEQSPSSRRCSCSAGQDTPVLSVKSQITNF